MITKVLDLTDPGSKEAQLLEAAQILRDGGLVAFPTETVYGLGADALRPEAAEKIYEAKGRPSDNPLIVHVAEQADVDRLALFVPDKAIKLMDAFWPGPLTLVFEKRPEVPLTTTGGLDTVAVRMPDNSIALELIRVSGCLLAGPSANVSGRPSPTRWQHVLEDLDGRIDAIVKWEDCQVGIESTVVDMTGRVPVVLRPGMVTKEQIAQIVGGKVVIDPAILVHRPRDDGWKEDLTPRAPGMKYKHYAPKAEMIIVKGERGKARQAAEQLKREREAQGLRVELLFYNQQAIREAARQFFAALREMDAKGVDLIIAQALPEEDPEGFAVMNRMMKSAGYQVIEV